MRRSLSQILLRKYTPKCASGCHVGLRRKFCTASRGPRADFAIARLRGRCFDSAATLCASGRATVAVCRMQGSAVSMRLFAPDGFFTISAIARLTFRCLFGIRLAVAGDAQGRAMRRRIGLLRMLDCAYPEPGRWEWPCGSGAPWSARRRNRGFTAPARAPLFCMRPEMPWACTGTLP